MRSRSLRTCLLRLMVFISLASMVVSVANGEGHPRSWPRTNFSSAVNTAKKFVCKEPQPRAYHLKGLIQPIVQHVGDTVSQPIYIVLKRCDGQSGCCSNPDSICSPVQVYHEEIEIELRNLTNKTRRQWIRVEQHDTCSCEIDAHHSRHQLNHTQLNVELI